MTALPATTVRRLLHEEWAEMVATRQVKTLTEADLAALSDKVVASAAKLGAMLRA